MAKFSTWRMDKILMMMNKLVTCLFLYEVSLQDVSTIQL